MVTHVKVDESTRARLKTFKKAHKCKSVDAVIALLLDRFLEQGAAPPSDAEDEPAPEAPQGKRQIYVREGLFSYKAIKKRRGMLEYYTGHDQGEVDLIITAFQEVRAASLFPLSPLAQPRVLPLLTKAPGHPQKGGPRPSERRGLPQARPGGARAHLPLAPVAQSPFCGPGLPLRVQQVHCARLL